MREWLHLRKLVFYFWKKTNYKALPLGKKKPLLKERGRQRLHSALASVEYTFVSLYFSEQRSRTELIQCSPLFCPSPTPRGGMGGLEKEGGGSKRELKGESLRIQCSMVSLSDWIMNWMIIRAWLVKLRRNLSSSSANQHAPSSTNQTPTIRGNGGEGAEASICSSMCLSPHISLSLFLLQHVTLWYSCPHLSPWETENSQSHNYGTELSISPSINPVGRGGTRERKEKAEKGMRDSNLGWRALLLPQHTPPRVQWGCLGWGVRELHILGMNLTLRLEVKQVTIQHRPHILIISK